MTLVGFAIKLSVGTAYERFKTPRRGGSGPNVYKVLANAVRIADRLKGVVMPVYVDDACDVALEDLDVSR